MKKKYIVLSLLVIGLGAYFVGGKFGSTIEYKQVEKEVVLDNLTGKINQLKGELIQSMFDVERGGHTEEDGIVTFDPNIKNGKINPKVAIGSFGDCQFKQSTVKYYVQKLDGKTITGKQANDIAFSDEKCKELMTRIVFTYPEGHEEWYNTCKKVDCDGKLKVIRTLTQ